MTTALATVVLFAPFLVAGGATGFEILRPMALVILGGLVTSTVVNLLIVPAAYLQFGFVPHIDVSEEDLFVAMSEADAARR